MQAVDKEKVKLAGQVHHLRDYAPQNETQQHHGSTQGEKHAPLGLRLESPFLGTKHEERDGDENPNQEHPQRRAEEGKEKGDNGEGEHSTHTSGFFGKFIINNQHHGRQGQQVQQVDTDGKACQIGDEHNPSVGVDVAFRVIVLLVPSQDAPEHQGGEKRRHSVNLTLDGGEPEGVGEAVGHSTHESGADGGDVTREVHLTIFGNEFAAQTDNGEIEEHYGQTTADGRHTVDAIGHLGRIITGKKGEDTAYDLESGCSGRVSHKQL